MKVDPKQAVSPAAAPARQPFRDVLGPVQREPRRAPRPEARELPGQPAAPTSALTGGRTTRANATTTASTTNAAPPANAAQPGLTQRPTGAPAQPHVVTAQVFSRARAQVDGEARRLTDARSDHVVTAQSLTHARSERAELLTEKQENRLLEALGRELTQQEPPPPPPRPIEGVGLSPQGAPSTPSPTQTPERPGVTAALQLVEKIETFMKANRPGLSLTLNNALGTKAEIVRVGPKEISVRLLGRNGPVDAQALSRIREELASRGLNVRQLTVA